MFGHIRLLPFFLLGPISACWWVVGVGWATPFLWVLQHWLDWVGVLVPVCAIRPWSPVVCANLRIVSVWVSWCCSRAVELSVSASPDVVQELSMLSNRGLKHMLCLFSCLLLPSFELGRSSGGLCLNLLRRMLATVWCISHTVFVCNLLVLNPPLLQLLLEFPTFEFSMNFQPMNSQPLSWIEEFGLGYLGSQTFSIVYRQSPWSYQINCDCIPWHLSWNSFGQMSVSSSNLFVSLVRSAAHLFNFVLQSNQSSKQISGGWFIWQMINRPLTLVMGKCTGSCCDFNSGLGLHLS